MYKPLAVLFRKVRLGLPKEGGIQVPFVASTENLRDLPQFLKPNSALSIKNYIVTTDGGLNKRQGITLLKDITGTNAITMLEKFTDDIYIFGYDNNVAALAKSTGVVTNIKTDFVTADAFSGQRYGDYFFVCNGGDPIGRISRTLTYGTQTANFTVGKIITGGTSGATAVILEDTDFGATGTLTLGNISGTFQNGEIITDNNTVPGSATTSSIVTWAYTAISGATKARVLKVIGPRLFAGNLSTDTTAVAYSAVDSGTNPPFTNWTVGTNANDPGLIRYANAGGVNAIEGLGPNIVVLGATGKWAFQIQTLSNNNLLTKIDQNVLERVDMGGSRATIVVPAGMFYVNNAGIFKIMSIGQSNVPFSEQEIKVSTALGVDFFKTVNLANASFVYNTKTDTLLLSCAKDSNVNNLVVALNVATGAFSEFTGWNINRFLNDNQTLYGAGSNETKIWTVLSGYDDDGQDIWTDYYQEVTVGGLETRQILLGQYVDGFLSPSTSLNVSFDIYDVKGTLVTNKLGFTWTSTGATGYGDGYGEASYGSSGFSGGEFRNNMVECFAGARGYIRNFQRVRFRITGHDRAGHELVWFKLLSRVKAAIRRRNLVQTT